MKAIAKFQKHATAQTTTWVLSTLMSKQPPVCEGGCFEGCQSGRKCGDVDDYLSDHGRPYLTVA